MRMPTPSPLPTATPSFRFDLQTAKPFDFTAGLDTTLTGRLPSRAHFDLHRFVAPFDGAVFMTPGMRGEAAVSLLDPEGCTLLTVGSFFLSYPIIAGETYYIRVSMTVGGYTVFVSARQ